MPIKIKDPAVYECYDSAVCQCDAGVMAELFEAFASQINNSGEKMHIDEILKVTDAIWHKDSVELEEPIYALRLKGGTKFLYTTAVITIDSSASAHPGIAFSLAGIRRHMTNDAWDKVFADAPWINRDAFEKVYEDD